MAMGYSVRITETFWATKNIMDENGRTVQTVPKQKTITTGIHDERGYGYTKIYPDIMSAEHAALVAITANANARYAKIYLGNKYIKTIDKLY